jgi:hypothetical protein
MGSELYMRVFSTISLRLCGLTHKSEAQSNMLKYAEKAVISLR